jgi:hypothetical protein
MVIGVFKSISVMTLSFDWLVKDRRTMERGFLSKTRVMVPQPWAIQSPTQVRARIPTRERRSLGRVTGSNGTLQHKQEVERVEER